MRSKKNKKGVSLLGLILVSLLIIMAALLAMKVAPEIIGYYTIQENVKATAADPELNGASVPQIRAAYQKRMNVADIKAIGAEDLDITKEDGKIVISFEYSKKIPLFKNVSLVIDFKGGNVASASGSS